MYYYYQYHHYCCYIMRVLRFIGGVCTTSFLVEAFLLLRYDSSPMMSLDKHSVQPRAIRNYSFQHHPGPLRPLRFDMLTALFDSCGANLKRSKPQKRYSPNILRETYTYESQLFKDCSGL